MSTSDQPVATVCGSEVRLYGPADEKTGIRPFRGFVECRHRGDALDVARSYEDRTPRPPQESAS